MKKGKKKKKINMKRKTMKRKIEVIKTTPAVETRVCPEEKRVLDKCVRYVRRLQAKLVVAAEIRDIKKIILIQRKLVHSTAARILAVKRVSSNAGANTPGVDGEIWKTDEKKRDAVAKLKIKARLYRAKPVRRVFIPKEKGKLRPLGIPTMFDRAMQALYLMGLQPVAETWADNNSYGFRPGRSTHDAAQKIYEALKRKSSH